jgi:tetratricopeptide (TPR) repeat protein
MVFVFTNIIVLAFAALVSWWLSGYDAKLTGHDEKAERRRRFIRCGITLLLLEVAFWNLWLYGRYNDVAAGALYLVIAVLLGLTWVSCISGMLAHGFNWLFDPEDHRELDTDKNQRDLDAIASLIKNGHKEAAIQLCQRLKESGDASVLAMETMLEHLGVQQNAAQKPKPLNEASCLRLQGKFTEAEAILKSLLAENPVNADAAMMLIRLYAQDLRLPVKAVEVLRALEQQPYIPASHLEFARRSIDEWSHPRNEPVATVVPPKSLDELLARGFLGTAMEILENKIKEQPRDFELRMKLAEVHALHCSNFQPAEKIIQQLQRDGNFSPEQIQSAKARLREWREHKPAGAA